MNPRPPVYNAVRAVGIIRPKFQPTAPGKIFADQLDVRGTAFWLKDYKLLVTCAHVVQDLLGSPLEVAGLLVVGNLGNYTRAAVDVIDFAHDLAILRVPEMPAPQLATEAQAGLEIQESSPQVGDAIAYAGFPLGMQLLDSTHAPTYAEGVIGAQSRNIPTRKQIQITGAVIGGFSGAPIVQKADPSKLVGVVANSPSKEAGEAHIFLAVSWEHVLALAKSASS